MHDRFVNDETMWIYCNSRNASTFTVNSRSDQHGSISSFARQQLENVLGDLMIFFFEMVNLCLCDSCTFRMLVGNRWKVACTPEYIHSYVEYTARTLT